MRGSLNRVRLKSSGDKNDQTPSKKARGDFGSAEPTQTKDPEQPGHANSRNMAMSRLDIATSNFTKASSGKEKLKPIRSHQVKLLDKVSGSNSNIDSISLKAMLSLETARNDLSKQSVGREKLKPVKSHLKTSRSEVRPLDKAGEENLDMDSMSLKNMLRFLDEEEVLLTQLQSKMSEELSRLQVEEHVFLHTLKIFGEKHDGLSNKSNGSQQQSSSEDHELIDALNMALKDSGESRLEVGETGKASFT